MYRAHFEHRTISFELPGRGEEMQKTIPPALFQGLPLDFNCPEFLSAKTPWDILKYAIFFTSSIFMYAKKLVLVALEQPFVK